MIPQRRPGQSFESHQLDMAEWMGCASVAEMNAAHDGIHSALCAWLGIESLALKQGRGERLTRHEQRLADIEEQAVLCVQRLAVQAGGKLP